MIAVVSDDENCSHLHDYGTNNRYDDQELPMTTTTSSGEQDGFQQSEDDEEDDEDLEFPVGPTSSSQPSLTPTPQTPPIEEVHQVPYPSSSHYHQKQQEQIESQQTLLNRTIITEAKASKSESDYQGPALAGCLTKNINESEEQEYSGHTGSVEGENDEREEEEEQEQAATIDADGASSISIIDELMNLESEYFSDPDFHDERPGKKSFVELEEERRLRRKRLTRQLVLNTSVEDSEEPDLDQLDGGDFDDGDDDDDDKLSEPIVDTSELMDQRDESSSHMARCSGEPKDHQESLRSEEVRECKPHERDAKDANLNISIESSDHETVLTVRSNDGTSQDITSLDTFVSAADSAEQSLVAEDTNCEPEYREENEAVSSRRESSDSINSIVQSMNQPTQEQPAIEISNFKVESECQVTASEAIAEFFLDESTLAEDVCTSLKLDSDILVLQQLNNRNETESDAEKTVERQDQLDEKDNDDDDDDDDGGDEDDTLNSCEFEKNLIEHQGSLDDLRSEMFDNVVANCGEIIETKDSIESEGSLDERRVMLVEMVSDYCDRLVELIKEEALKQIEQISSSGEDEMIISKMNLSHLFQIESTSSARLPVACVAATNNKIDEEDDGGVDEPTVTTGSASSITKEKKIYTSSMYYNGQLESFPTIQEQLKQCRTIAQQLEREVTYLSEEGGTNKQDTTRGPTLLPATSGMSDSLDHKSLLPSQALSLNDKRAGEMFRCRRDRMGQFTLESKRNRLADNRNDDNNFNTTSLSLLSRPRRASLEPAHLTRGFHNNNKRKGTEDNGQLTGGTEGSSKLLLLNCDSLESIDQLDCDPANMTDTEYEAPRVRRRPLPARATTTPFGNRTSRLVKMGDDVMMMNLEVDTTLSARRGESCPPPPAPPAPKDSLSGKFRPFLDSSTLKDIERLREWSPYGEFNEHDSVSPELCLKLVQGLRGEASCSSPSVIISALGPSIGDTEANKQEVIEPMEEEGQLDRASGVGKKDRGAQMFERRQLQSSDWIVSSAELSSFSQESAQPSLVGEPPTQAQVPKSSSRESDDDAQVSKQNYTSNVAPLCSGNIIHGSHLPSRPSLSGETLMVVVDESEGDQVIELAPIIMSHTQPKLQVATITKTPSFSASSWRVIECDSPDLLTSHDDGEETQDDDERMDEENIQDAPHIDDDDCEINVAPSDNVPEEGEQKVLSVVEAGDQIRTAELSYDNGSSEFNQPHDHVKNYALKDSIAPPLAVAKIEEIPLALWSSCGRQLDRVDRPDEMNYATGHYANTASVHARSQSRSSDSHRSTILNWRPQVTTPTWMTTNSDNFDGEADGNYSNNTTTATTATTTTTAYKPHPKQESDGAEAMTGRHEQIGQQYYNTLGHKPNMFDGSRNRRTKHSLVVSSIRDNYQNLIKESTNNTYRSYRYPFADKDHDEELNRQRRGRSCSLIRSNGPILDTPVVPQNQDPHQAHSFLPDSAKFSHFSDSQGSSELRRSACDSSFQSQNGQTIAANYSSNEKMEKYGEFNRSDKGLYNLDTNRHRANDRTWVNYRSSIMEPVTGAFYSRDHPNGQPSVRVQDSDVSEAKSFSGCSQNQNRMLAPTSCLRESFADNWPIQSNEQNIGPPRGHSNHDHWQSKQCEQARDSSVPASWRFGPTKPNDQTQAKGNFSQRRMPIEYSSRSCQHHDHHHRIISHITREDSALDRMAVDRKCHLSGNSSFSRLDSAPDQKVQDGALSSSSSSSSSRADVHCLRVSIKLPNKSHRIVIYRRPKVTFASVIYQ